MFCGHVDSAPADDSATSFRAASLGPRALSRNVRLDRILVHHREPGGARAGDQSVAGEIWRSGDDRDVRHGVALGVHIPRADRAGKSVLVPTISGLRERDPAAIPAVYRASYRLVFFLGVPAFAFLVTVSPIVSRIWLGRYEPVFVTFVALLAAGWLVNILSNPAYVVDLGTGALRWVSIGARVRRF